MQKLVFIGLFGLAGILTRYGIDRLVLPSSNGFPTSTFLINILGSFLAGLVFVLGERDGISPDIQLALLVGFCGGFTTFSAYSLQSFQLIDKDKMALALVYLVASPILGLLAASIPIVITRRFIT